MSGLWRFYCTHKDPTSPTGEIIVPVSEVESRRDDMATLYLNRTFVSGTLLHMTSYTCNSCTKCLQLSIVHYSKNES